MPRRKQKADLPTKVCPVCGRSFAWRKKWAEDWEHVRYCSQRCRNRRKQKKGQSSFTIESG